MSVSSAPRTSLGLVRPTIMSTQCLKVYSISDTSPQSALMCKGVSQPRFPQRAHAFNGANGRCCAQRLTDTRQPTAEVRPTRGRGQRRAGPGVENVRLRRAGCEGRRRPSTDEVNQASRRRAWPLLLSTAYLVPDAHDARRCLEPNDAPQSRSFTRSKTLGPLRRRQAVPGQAVWCRQTAQRAHLPRPGLSASRQTDAGVLLVARGRRESRP